MKVVREHNGQPLSTIISTPSDVPSYNGHHYMQATLLVYTEPPLVFQLV